MNKYNYIGLVIGILLFLYGGGAVVTSLFFPVHKTVEWYLSVFGFMSSGLISSILSLVIKSKNKPVIQSSITKQKPVQIITETKMAEIVTNPTSITKLTDDQIADFQCLNHLTVRFSGDKEAVEACRKLQERLFELYYAQKTVVEGTTR